jgi:hypothetical protein
MCIDVDIEEGYDQVGIRRVYLVTINLVPCRPLAIDGRGIAGNAQE